jgi:outer membrane murein-binding lipoprotein Lpp
MNKKIMAVVVLIALLFVGTIFYYNGELNDKNSKIASLNNQIANLNSQISNLTSQVRNLINMTRTNENITFINVNWYTAGTGYGEYDWTLSLALENIGNATAIINNVIINGQSYSSFKPIPIVTPSIQNGYALSPNQSVTIIMQGSNSSNAPSSDSYVYVLTAIGNSYSYYLGS